MTSAILLIGLAYWSPLRVTIRLSRSIYSVQPEYRTTVVVTNATRKPVSFVGAFDTDFIVKNEAGRIVPLPNVIRCYGLISYEDLVVLRPGKSYIFEDQPINLSRPGAYRVSCRFSLSEFPYIKDSRKWWGQIASNIVTVRVH